MVFKHFCENYFFSLLPICSARIYQTLHFNTHFCRTIWCLLNKKGCENTPGSRHRAFSLLGTRNLLILGLALCVCALCFSAYRMGHRPWWPKCPLNALLICGSSTHLLIPTMDSGWFLHPLTAMSWEICIAEPCWTWSSLFNSFSSRIHGWTSPMLTGWVLLPSILVRSGQSWGCWRGHAAHGSHPWRIWSRVMQVQVCWGPRQALLYSQPKGWEKTPVWREESYQWLIGCISPI